MRDITVILVVIFVMIALITVAFKFLWGENNNTEYRERCSLYNDNWTVSQEYSRQILDLPAHVSSQKSTEISFKKKLPAVIEKYYAISIRNYHQMLEVFIDGELVYKYPKNDRTNFLNLITDDWHIIDLSPSDSRKTIEIKLINTTNVGFDGYVSGVYYGDANSIIHHLRVESEWYFASSLILIVIGAYLMIRGYLWRISDMEKANACMGMVLFSFGAWLADRSKMPIFPGNIDVVFILAFIFLLMVAPFVFLYCYYRFGYGQKFSLLGFRFGMIYAGVVILLCVFAGIPLEIMTTLSYLIALISMIYAAVMLFRLGFGRESELISLKYRILDRVEFMAAASLPVGIVIETILFSDQLWTEVSGLYRTIITLYGIVYIGVLLVRGSFNMKKRQRIEERLHESQLELMMGQIQPHFIFNTLSSIRTLIKVSPDTAYNMVYDFSNYLRANVDNITNLDGINFSAEVEHIKSYVNIEKIRFGDRLNVEFDINASDFTVPPLSIQPLVENAIKHGVCKRPEGGTVYLRSYEEGDNYVVVVEDDGVGFDKDRLLNAFIAFDEDEERVGMESDEVAARAIQEIMDSSSIMDREGNVITLKAAYKGDLSGNGSEEHESTGMRNIALRLREMVNAKMEINSQEGVGTTITVYFPKGGVSPKDGIKSI